MPKLAYQAITYLPRSPWGNAHVITAKSPEDNIGDDSEFEGRSKLRREFRELVFF